MSSIFEGLMRVPARQIVPVAAILAVCFVVYVVRATPKRTAGARRWPVRKRAPLSRPEQVLYWRLCEAFPGQVVLSQVALSQLIDVDSADKRRGVRNSFDRLVVDFVVCSKAFGVSAVIKLDDRSHERSDRVDADARKTAVLGAAGYALIRVQVSKMPTASELRELVGFEGITPV